MEKVKLTDDERDFMREVDKHPGYYASCQDAAVEHLLELGYLKPHNPEDAYGGHWLLTHDGLTAYLTAEIQFHEATVEKLYRRRAGRKVDDTWAWCSCCGRVEVNAAAGIDTCSWCISNV